MYGGTLKAQVMILCIADHTCIKSEATFVSVLCGKKVGGFTTSA